MKARIVGLVTAVLLVGATAIADPVTVTSGGAFVMTGLTPFGSVDLFGNGLQLSASGLGGASASFGEGLAGTTVNLDGFVAANPRWQGSATINGVHYDIAGGPVETNLSGILSFTTVPFVLPTVFDGVVHVTTPMTVQGTMSMVANPFPGAPVLFTFDVTGSGTAGANLTSTTLADGTHRLVNTDGTGFGWTATAVAPTPEPASLLLLGTGAVAALWRRSRRLRS